jgi:SAM-dependent methyltransferase
VRFLQGDVVDLDVGAGYDVINAFDVLYHIVEDDRWRTALERLARALKPGGVLLATPRCWPGKGSVWCARRPPTTS